MAKQFEAEETHYYDYYPTEEDLMGETSLHFDLVHYLIEVFRWQFRDQPCAVYGNLNFYQKPNYYEYPLAPDIAVIKGIAPRRVRSWRVGKSGPAPQVVLEIASEETWKKDLQEKPFKYAQMGVKEYFAYDPHERPLDRETSRRLFGWHLDQGSGQMREMALRADGGLWSQHLESSLVPDGEYLRLYESNGQRRLTKEEAEARRADEEAEARRAETRRADEEAEARRAETRRADEEAEARRAEARRAEALAEKLRSLGIDPNQL